MAAKRVLFLTGLLSGLLCLTLPAGTIAQSQSFPWPYSPEGGPIQISGSSGANLSPSVAASDQLFLVVWYQQSSTGSEYDIYGVMLDRNGNIVGDEIPICTVQNDLMFPAVAWDGVNFLVVWQDHRSGSHWDIYGAFVSPDGVVSSSIPIAVGQPGFDQEGPTLCFGGDNYLVAWQGKHGNVWNLYYTQVSTDGDVQSPVQLNPSSKNQVSPSVAFAGDRYVIVWQDMRNGKFWNIYGAEVGTDGTIITAPFCVTFTGQLNRWNPVVAWNGSYYFVAWVAIPNTSNSYLMGRRILPGGQPVDIVDLTINIQGSTANKAFPDILWDGTDFLVAWEEEPEGQSNIDGVSVLSQLEISASEPGQISIPGVAINPSVPKMAQLGDDLVPVGSPDVLVVWQEGPNSNNQWNIFGQIIARPQPWEGPSP